MLKTVAYFCENHIIILFYFLQDSNKQYLFEIEIFCNIVNVFTVPLG